MQLFASIVIASALSAGTASTAYAQQRSPELIALDNATPGTLINDPGSLDWSVFGPEQSSKPVRSAEAPGGAALQVKILKAGTNAYDVGINVPITAPVKAGTDVTVRFAARTVSADTPDGRGKIGLRFQRNSAPYPGFGDTTVSVGNAWDFYEATGKATVDLPPGLGVLNFQLSGTRQVIEIAQTIIVAGATSLAAARAPAQPRPPQPVAIDPALAALGPVVNDPADRSWNTYGALGTFSAITVPGLPGGEAATRIVTASKGINPFDAGAEIKLAGAIAKGDIFTIDLLARAAKSDDPAGAGTLGIRIQQNVAPFSGFADKQIALTPKWQRIRFRTQATVPIAAGSAVLSFHFASRKQTVEIGSVVVVKEGAATASTGPAKPANNSTRPGGSAEHAAVLKSLRSQLPGTATLVNDPDVTRWKIAGAAPTIVDATGPIGRKALSVRIAKAGHAAYDITAHSPVAGAIKSGDTIFGAFQVRASSADNEAGSGVIAAAKIEERGGSYAAIAESSAQVSDKWTFIYAAGVAARDYAPGETQVALHLAGSRQTLELGNAYVFNVGPNVPLANLPVLRIDYPGRAADAPWRAAARQRIDAIRRSDLIVKVVDTSGAAIPGARVRVEMQEHAFHFGTFVGHDVTKDTPKDKRLRTTFGQLFNTATSPLYWADWGWQSPSRREGYKGSMAYLHAHDIAWRGHPIIYPGENFLPTRLKQLGDNPAAFRKAVLDHVRDVAAVAAKYHPFAIDVINEPRDGAYTIDRIGIDGVAEAFKIAKAAMPHAQLFVNDYGIISGGGYNDRNVAFYHDFLSKIINAGAPVGGIGVQGHFGATLTHPARVFEIFNDFAKYGLPLQITEFDVDTSDEATQADYTRDLLTIAFSHPGVNAFTTWGYWEGDHWRPAGAMIRRDWTPKPNYGAWRKLVFGDWWTDETQISGTTGAVRVRGFLGRYRITASAGGKTASKIVSLDQATAPVELLLAGLGKSSSNISGMRERSASNGLVAA